MNALLRPIVPALILTGATLACHPGGGGETAEEAAAVREAALAPREVRLVLPEEREERPALQLVGELRAFDTLSVSSEVAGRVDAVMVEVGDRVRRGQPLLEVDRESFQIHLQLADAELAAARANLVLAEKDLERKSDLVSDKTIPQASFDQAQSAHDLAKAQVASAEAARRLAERNWKRSVVRAPGAGSITARHTVGGTWADVGQPLLEMALGDRVKIAARVPASWAPRLAGLEGFDFTVGASPTVHHAELYSVDPVVNESSRSFEAVGVAANPAGVLRPGMFANVTLEAPATTRSLWLPVSAVATSDMSQVLLVVDAVIVFQRVKIGRRADGWIEILDGIDAGQPVVAEVAGLHRGVPVTVID
jgi:RND family efflux transporter MFP subunit